MLFIRYRFRPSEWMRSMVYNGGRAQNKFIRVETRVAGHKAKLGPIHQWQNWTVGYTAGPAQEWFVEPQP